jgi:hypothetical protein
MEKLEAFVASKPIFTIIIFAYVANTCISPEKKPNSNYKL